MTYYITHIIPEKLPEKNYKQISFLSITKDNYEKDIRIMSLGYKGSRKLTESQLSEEIAEKKVFPLRIPIIAEGELHLWIDPQGKLWTSKDNLFKEEKVDRGASGIKPTPKSEVIFNKVFQPKLKQIQTRTRLAT